VTNLTVLKNIHELPLGMAVPLMFLCFGSIFSGYFFKDIFVGPGTDFFKHTILVRGLNSTLDNIEFLPVWVKLIPTFFSLFGLVAALVLCSKRRRQGLTFFSESGWGGYFFRKFRQSFRFLSNKWYFDSIYNHYFALPFLGFAYRVCFKFIDQYFLKLFGPVGVIFVVSGVSRRLVKRHQTGLINDYAFFMCYFLLVFLFIIWLGRITVVR
jgi:NADH:ubiquinone oxidoreductase subunit 5 (subunit L)/multisubunit Na+/H+ antiporter MnhA subunit